MIPIRSWSTQHLCLLLHMSIIIIIITIITIIISFLASFSHQRLMTVFLWSLRDSKFPQVSKTLLSILANLNNSVVWMVSIHTPISNSYNPLSKLLGTVPSAPITIGITITIMSHSFFRFLAMSKYLSMFSFSFIFTLIQHDDEVHYMTSSLSFFLSFFLSFC